VITTRLKKIGIGVSALALALPVFVFADAQGYNLLIQPVILQTAGDSNVPFINPPYTDAGWFICDGTHQNPDNPDQNDVDLRGKYFYGNDIGSDREAQYGTIGENEQSSFGSVTTDGPTGTAYVNKVAPFDNTPVADDTHSHTYAVPSLVGTYICNWNFNLLLPNPTSTTPTSSSPLGIALIALMVALAGMFGYSLTPPHA